MEANVVNFFNKTLLLSCSMGLSISGHAMDMNDPALDLFDDCQKKLRQSVYGPIDLREDSFKQAHASFMDAAFINCLASETFLEGAKGEWLKKVVDFRNETLSLMKKIDGKNQSLPLRVRQVLEKKNTLEMQQKLQDRFEKDYFTDVFASSESFTKFLSWWGEGPQHKEKKLIDYHYVERFREWIEMTDISFVTPWIQEKHQENPTVLPLIGDIVQLLPLEYGLQQSARMATFVRKSASPQREELIQGFYTYFYNPLLTFMTQQEEKLPK